jgi:hypothetical protein
MNPTTRLTCKILTASLLCTISCTPLSQAEPEDGFQSIFNGTLKDWEGDPVYWKAENETLIGEVRPETLLKQNSFIIWRGGELADFELKFRHPDPSPGFP